ncbi:uncharacterized protein LOC116264845 [Nymphaea colorata]|uniref:MHD domain-containing protein n=1 Tax=Nymphaea colorata TaxID=210225 RepID=A0A5K0Y3L2_9MAGN|nr:uncharacterized protein LOC116264845 [Nymphaea colorata]
MACLALSLQPVNGSDILLQTREWFPPARALVVLSAFRHTRLAFAGGKNTSSEDADPTLGDDPLSAAGGQVIVGKESKYRVIYRLVNGIYVLGITTVDHDDSVNNVFECIEIVNQAVRVIVTACRGVDVSPDKLGKKYAEIYMALDIILRGISSIRLATILASIHGDGIPKMVHSAFDSEGRIRGAEGWNQVEFASSEHRGNVEVFSNAIFELPPETLAAGDEYAATIAPAPQSSAAQTSQQQQQPEQPAEEAVEKDPFAASDAINKPEALVGGFNKAKDAPSDLSVALAGLEVTALPPAAASQSTFIGVEGFEGEYGGIEFGNEEATLAEAFEGFDNAFGGGLDASEFVTTTKVGPKLQGLGGLEALQSGQSAAKTASAATAAGAGTPLENLLVKQTEEMKGPELFISEEINAEFCESLLVRVGLRGTVFFRTLLPKDSNAKDTEFSFRVENSAGIKKAAMQSSILSNLGNGMFHVRTPPVDKPVPILKYSLQPHLTPLPLRVRLVKRLSGTLLSLMIQYAADPELSEPLKNVTFVVKLPADPTLLKVSPKAILSRSEKELRWSVQEIPLKGPPGCLRAQMPIDYPDEETAKKEIELTGEVKFSVEGRKLSGISLSSASEGKTDFYEGVHRYSTGSYLCY